MSPYLRPATPTDAGRLGAMIGAAVVSHPWKPRLHSAAEDIAHAGTMIERGWVTVAAAPDSAAPLGFLARDGAYVHALFVAPEAQGAGIGRALIEHAKAQSPQLDLWTFAANEGAQRFYERAGFAVLERGDGSQNEEGLPEIRYRWQAETAAPQETAP